MVWVGIVVFRVRVDVVKMVVVVCVCRKLCVDLYRVWSREVCDIWLFFGYWIGG